MNKPYDWEKDHGVGDDVVAFVVKTPPMIAPEDLMDRVCNGLQAMRGETGWTGLVTLTLVVPAVVAEQVEEAAARNGVELTRV